MSLQLLTILTAAGGMALVALTHNAYPVYFMLAVLLALVIISFAASRLSPRSLRWRRRAFDRVFENEEFVLETQVTNRGRLPHFLLSLADTLPPLLEVAERDDFVVPVLWPGESVVLPHTVRARKRGVYPLGPLRVWVSDPFGFFQRQAQVEAPAEAVVYPKPLPVYGELARTGMEARGMAAGERSRVSESGLDFYGIRDYRPGDELRRIHWPATGHHNRLTVIEFERGASENLAVVLDTAAGTEFGEGVQTTLEVAVRAAASLLHWTLNSEGVAFLATDSPTGPSWLAIDRPDREYEALEVLARVQANTSLPPSILLEWAAHNLGPGANIAVVTSSPDRDLPAAISMLCQRHMRVAVLVLDASSFDPNAADTTSALGTLEAAGATAVAFRRQSDLGQTLERLLIASN